jgi:hypothetical protein
VTNGFGNGFEIKQFQEWEKLFQSSAWHQITNGMSRSLMEPRFVLNTEVRFGLGAEVPGRGFPGGGPRGPEVVDCGGDGE